MKSNKLSPKISIKIAAIYIFVMGIGMFTMRYIFGYSYTNPDMVYVLGWIEVVLSSIAIFTVIKFSSWKQIGFGKIRLKHILWLLPYFAIFLLLLSQVFVSLNVNGISSLQLKLLIATAITTLLVGFSEELMFRGIVLRGMLAKYGIYKSMFISAVAFMLLHVVNVLGGLSVQAMLVQLVIVFISGLLLAPVVLKLRSLIPLIIYHFLWDFSMMSSQIASVDSPGLVFFLPFIEIIFIIIIWFSMRKETPETLKI